MQSAGVLAQLLGQHCVSLLMHIVTRRSLSQKISIKEGNVFQLRLVEKPACAAYCTA